MLKEQNDEQLKQKGVKEDVIPFYQIWQELVNEKTLDIYQYRILTSLSALEELAEVLKKTISGIFTNDANIESCREETLYILNSDHIMSKHYRAIGNRLKHSLGLRPKSDAEKIRLLTQIEYAINEIAPTYERYAIEELKNSIGEGKMEEIHFLANVVASQASHNGWSSQALNDLLRFFREEKEFDEQWDLFRQAILDHEEKDFDILIHIPFRNRRNKDNPEIMETLEKLGLDIHTYEQLTVEYSAINRLSKYHKAFNAEQLYRTYDYLDSSGKVFEYTKIIFTDDNKMAIREKLTGAFGYANISRASLFQEEKYMNLWVALESLARTKMYSDIISCIKETVPAAMSLRYIYRIVRNYVEDCIRCRVEFDFPGHSVDMKQETKQKLVRETIEIFRDQELYTMLLQKSHVNSLLEHRTEKVHEILNDMAILKNKIKNHHDRVGWQIQRLYRIRNEIVHSALQNKRSLVTYTEHLYDYLSTYIAEIVTCMAEGKEGTLEETLAIIRDNYEVFIALMDQNEQVLIEEKVVKTGVINLI